MKKIWIATLEGTFRDIEITEKELPRAMWNFTHNFNGIYEGGAGKIKALTPDYVQSMGWNKGHRPTAEEWGYVKNDLGRSLEDTMSSIKVLISNTKTLEELEIKVKNFLLPSGTLNLPVQQKVKVLSSGIGDY